MVGAYRVVIQNKKIKFDFEIRRNITILRGDSATGKTTLVEMIREYEELGPDSGIELQCEKDCVVLSGRQWKKQLADLSQSIVFIDEGNAFTASKEFAAAIQKTDNYYVLVTREGLETLPYSVTEIYGIRTSKHFGDLKQTYNEFFRIYGKPMGLEKLKPTAIITEDSNSGFQFFRLFAPKTEFSANLLVESPTFSKCCPTVQGRMFWWLQTVRHLVRRWSALCNYLPSSRILIFTCQNRLNG